MTLYFKILGPNRMACHGGKGQWPPIGEWTHEEEAIPCWSGWHMARPRELFSWLNADGQELYLAEAEGVVEANDKVVATKARLVKKLPWDEKTARLFAADCAERVLVIFEKEYPNDKRPREAIDVARRFARGEATREELASVSASASYAYAAAAYASAASASASAYAAADAAAYAAAYAAADADAAAYAAERKWQVEHLMTTYLGVKLEC